MKVRYSRVGGLLAGIYQAAMLALYLIFEHSQDDGVDNACLYIGAYLTFPWSFTLIPLLVVFLHGSIPTTLFFGFFTAVNAFALYRIGNSVTLGIEE